MPESQGRPPPGPSPLARNAGVEMWLILVVVRIVWAALPQTGYLHPDEFFQSPEVAAGDLLGLDVLRTWEFSPDQPVRTITLPLLVSGTAFLPLRLVNLLLSGHHDNTAILNTHVLVALPRLLITGLSLVGDVILVKLARRLQVKLKLCMWLYASSSVALVFFTRTLSNTLEAFFFSLLLYCAFPRQQTASKMAAPSRADGQGDQSHGATSKGPSRPGHQREAAMVGITLALGFFNRPTFLLYAAAPCCIWMLTQASIATVIMKAVATASFLVPTCVILILGDSVYFGSLDLRLVDYRQLMDLLRNNLTVTPYNFILYNLDSSNLAQHGLHTRWTHGVVNLPMLFGPLALLSLLMLAVLVWRCARRGTDRDWRLLGLAACGFCPVLLLSAFPHQEPRFLIPILPVVVLLSAEYLRLGRFARVWKVLCLVFNVLTCVFFGAFHQGGLVPCLAHLQEVVAASQTSSAGHHFIFYHTYMPPRHLLAIPGEQPRMQGKHALLDTEVKQFMVHDLKGAPLHDLQQRIWDISFIGSQKRALMHIYVAAPASLHSVVSAPHPDFSLILTKRFFPHLSMEDLPELNLTQSLSGGMTEKMTAIHKVFSLNLYKVRLKS